MGRVSDKSKLLDQLQRLRLQLHELAEERGSLTDPDVIAISEEADRLIVVLQLLQRSEMEDSAAARE
ncbi:Spo0E family sporulation regulatory protein-aspartic acid phosphatase [Paenibacillus sp. 1P07SE]|uniref:Spo0E family sporulation regulatory protein-aspartic acid phosphatase n=1 Tax=Paenibacillus sp. 1P07SE TaxID=3132209 RepID=UPI0039A5309F